jgi:hypothetical protein
MAPAEREAILHCIEAGSLRAAVARFPGVDIGLPTLGNGNGAHL